ncbi:MAG TPA: hypothetical protein VKR61_20880 [Bryobacteraceae bacterium]|nr:hypothetical protein [Bryobacteraceae bacterium]
MIGKMMDLLFGCHHHRLTRPITPVHRIGTPSAHAYVTCLECGKQFYYDTHQMRIGTPIPLPLVPANPGTCFQNQQ